MEVTCSCGGNVVAILSDRGWGHGLSENGKSGLELCRHWCHMLKRASLGTKKETISIKGWLVPHTLYMLRDAGKAASSSNYCLFASQPSLP